MGLCLAVAVSAAFHEAVNSLMRQWAGDQRGWRPLAPVRAGWAIYFLLTVRGGRAVFIVEPRRLLQWAVPG